MQVISYPSSVELGTTYTVTPVPTAAETDAIIIKPRSSDSTSVADIGGNTQGTLYIDFTKGSLTSLTIKTYGSLKNDPGAGDWYIETIEKDDDTTLGKITLGEQYITLTATGKLAWHFPIGAFRSYKITIQGVGTATNSALTLDCSLKVN